MSTDIGPELKARRESREISLERAAGDLRLRPGFLRELEECRTAADFPGVYHRLSLRMYARYLGLEIENTRPTRPAEERVRLPSVGHFIRRMGRPPRPPRLSPAQRSRLIGLAKTTSAAVVTILAVGLWSLNAKLSRLNIDETKPRVRAAVPAQAAPLPVLIELPRCTLEEPVRLILGPAL